METNKARIVQFWAFITPNFETFMNVSDDTER